MSNRIFNFSAGPAMLPTEVLEKSAAAMLDYQGKGFGIAEVSHRGKEFEAVNDEANALCKKLLGLGDTHDVLFLQGGATQFFTVIPLNYLRTSADYLVDGEWSKKAIGAAKEVGAVRSVASSESTNFDHAPAAAEWDLSKTADYFHVCSNETVHGHQMQAWPTHPNLVVDASSEFMSRPHPVKDCAVVYAGAQKNLGPAGVVVVIVRKDLHERQKKTVSKLWSFKDQAENRSMINTPPTLGIYILLEAFRWLEAQGGLAAMAKRSSEKASLIYGAIDKSNGFYRSFVSVPEQRSQMNATFTLPDENKTEAFLKATAVAGMVGLKGYRTVGGVRVSMYNAMPVEGCRLLSQFMTDFALKNG